MRHLSLVALVMLAGCGTYSPSEAKEEFWTAFHSADLDGVASARQHLIDSLNVDPHDDEVSRLIGMSYFLSANEGPQGALPLNQRQQTIQNHSYYLQQARDRAVEPYSKALDTAIYSGDPWFQGVFNNDAAKQKEGSDLMDGVIAQFPVLGNFSSASILIRAPQGSDAFNLGVERYFRYYELCLKAPIDREHPDLSGMAKGTVVDHLCMNSPNVAHALPGGIFLFGDTLVKAGKLDAARAAYQSIKQTDGFESWRFKDQVDQRLSSDLQARAEGYANPDPTQQPPLGASFCFACHQ